MAQLDMSEVSYKFHLSIALTNTLKHEVCNVQQKANKSST